MSAGPSAAERPATLLEAAAAAGYPLPGPTRVLLEDLEARLALRPRSRVAHLDPSGGPPASGGIRSLGPAPPLRRLLPRDRRVRLVALDSDLGPSRLHAQLAGHGPFDLVILDCPDRVDLARFADVLFHVRKGGALVLWFPPPEVTRPPRSPLEAVTPPQTFLRDLHAHVTAVPRDAPTVPPSNGVIDRLRLVRATQRLVVGPRHLLVLAQVQALAKLRDDEVDTVLEIRGPSTGRVLVRVPGVRFASRCRVRESAPVSELPGGVPMPPSYDAPPVSLREYADVVCRPQQVLVQRNLLLPDTYRKPQSPRLQHHATEEVGERFARVRDRPRDREPAQPLAGSYFHLDIEWPGHFGHAVTEQLSRLWALPAARAAHPDLKVLLSRRAGRPTLTGFEQEVFGAAGVAEGDVVLFDRPVRVERLLAATPMYATPEYAHPDLVALWERVGDVLAARAPERTGRPGRVFCTRRGARRPCHNAAEVEARFAAAGFAVVHPEDLPLAEQVRMFREADVVGGFAGSALLGTMFARRPGHVVVMSSESYTARNEHLIASLLGHRLDVAWCRPDIPQPPGGWHVAAFGSGFTYDAAREGVFLDDVLAGL